MKESAWIVDSNFPVKGLGLAGVPQPTNLNRSVFVSESSLDTAIATIHKASDLPSLTLNDKVFAARYTIAGMTPLSTEEEPEPDPEPEVCEDENSQED